MTTAMTKTPIYVDTLPKSIKTATGTIINPTLETCRHGSNLSCGEGTQLSIPGEKQNNSVG